MTHFAAANVIKPASGRFVSQRFLRSNRKPYLLCLHVCVCEVLGRGGRVCLFVLASVWFENSVVSLRCACIYALFFACCCCRKLVHTSGRARFSPLFMLSGRIRSVNNDDGREKTKTTTSSGTTIGLCCRCCRLFVYFFESDVCKRVRTFFLGRNSWRFRVEHKLRRKPLDTIRWLHTFRRLLHTFRLPLYC